MHPYPDALHAPLLEFDPAPQAFIEPSRVLPHLAAMPARVVLCFFHEVLEAVRAAAPHDAGHVVDLKSEMGRNPVWKLNWHGVEVAFLHPGVGAPLAGGFLEEGIALGGRQFVAVGGAGVLDSALTVGHVVVPTSAMRDEGLSYHYLPASRTVDAHAGMTAHIRATLERHHVPYVAGLTWTTDALYRETTAKIAARRAEGCLTVEMEAAAFFAVAQFRGVPFGQILYGGDDLGGDAWDHRDWIGGQAGNREKLFWLAVEAAASAPETT
ncbi:MAG: nucleoside phosphorylase [Pleurocapsa minor GSE-CHR-MK-17-07R]|nr:nucleoside phosphorylase [Pleurocapsa minor GSE-CHR-MK 17-07R]